MDYRKIDKAIEEAKLSPEYLSLYKQQIDLLLAAGFKEVDRQIKEEKDAAS